MWSVSSSARKNASSGLKSVQNVLSFSKTTQGKPSSAERSLFAASAVFAYAVWEFYAEELSIESVKFLAGNIDEQHVPEAARKLVEHNSKTWDLAVHPGWRQLWIDRVSERARGKEGTDDSFGLSTANESKVKRLFEHIGVDPFLSVNVEVPSGDSPTSKLDDLVRLRGQIAHTGKAPTDFYKGDAVWYQEFIGKLATAVDESVRDQLGALTGSKPW
jgi:hypothetical protein